MLPPADEVNPLGDPTIPRTVRSRVREPKERNLAGVTVNDAGEAFMLLPHSAELLTGVEIVDRLATKCATPWCVATDDAGRLYTFLEEFGPTRDDYKARGSVREARAYKKGGGIAQSATVHASFTDFGWGKRARAIVLDPRAFSDLPADEVLLIPRGERADVARLLMRLCLWAGDVMTWCQTAGVDIRPGRGGIASQFLTDARWWPERRRKVPRRLNTAARDELPGNYYRMFSEEVHASALELDQKSSHHNVARRVTFTDSDTIAGYGAIGDRANDSAPLWVRPADPRWAELTSYVGLFWVRVQVQRAAVTRKVPLPQLAAEGPATIPVWSSELADLEAEPGVEIIGLVGAIVSRTSSTALNGYAEWALGQLEEHAGNARRMVWLKPLLLAVYGTMAQSAKPYVSFSTEPTTRSEPELVVLGTRLVSVHVARSQRAQEPRYVNVADRGIIEAETRAETVRVARALEHADDEENYAQLVAMYADSVLVAPRFGSFAGDGDEHADWVAAVGARARAAGAGVWRETQLTRLEMLAVNAYRSAEVTKRPGVARAGRKPLQ